MSTHQSATTKVEARKKKSPRIAPEAIFTSTILGYFVTPPLGLSLAVLAPPT